MSIGRFPVWDTEVFPHQSSNYTSVIAGNGSFAEPWDSCHINSVDKDDNGDYLVSLRHLNSVVKIAGKRSSADAKPGDVLWRVGTLRSDFHLNGFNFSRQHMARFISSTSTETIFSHFDNAYDGILPSAARSSGQIIALDHRLMTARLLNEYPSPDGMLSDSQGSMQVLANGNVFIGWGYRPSFSEFAKDGKEKSLT